ncbi:MAG: PfkB family carbohydrate kinase [Planctomycetota bacterium]
MRPGDPSAASNDSRDRSEDRSSNQTPDHAADPAGDATPAEPTHPAAAALPGLRALVVGDCLLDRHTRVQPDPALEDAVTTDPGGAAVVALHLAALGVSTTILTRWTADGAGSSVLRPALDAAGVEVLALPRSTPITLKRRVLRDGRVIAHKQQGAVEPCPHDDLFDRALGRAMGRDPNLVLACDFGLGLWSAKRLAEVERRAFARGAYLAGDVSGPQPTLLAMRRFDLITPTDLELHADPEASDDPWRSARAWVTQPKSDHRPRSAIVTLGAQGLVAARSGGTAVRLPSMAREAVDPTGAGDALLAAAAAAGALGLRFEEQARWAAAAAGVHVETPGNRAIDRAAFFERLVRTRPRPTFGPLRRNTQTGSAVAA